MRMLLDAVLILFLILVLGGIGCSNGDSGSANLSCGTPPAPENGFAAACVGPLASGDSCDFVCSPGFTLSGSTTCENGLLAPATCQPVGLASCDASTPPPNGGVGDCTASLPSGASCQPTCDMGFTASGPTLCNDGQLVLGTVCHQ